MRAVLLSLVIAACGKGSPQPEVKPIGSDNSIGSDKPVVPPPPAPVEPSVVAVIAGNHVKVLALTPAGIAVKRDAKLPTTPADVRWLDHEHLVAVSGDGKAYLVTGDSVAAYKMPRASAWKVKAGAGEERAKFPMKLTLSRTTAGVELASCATYYMGDDDPCVNWGVVLLGTSLEVGAVTTQSDAPTDDVTEPEIKPAASTAQPTIEWKDHADGTHANVALKLGAASRDWKSEEPCPITDATIKWLSASPPIIAFVTTSDCGEGGPHDEEHLLRLPALDDFSPDGATLVLGPALWARNVESGWTLHSGDRVVGSLESVPVMRPMNDPTGPAVVPSTTVAPGASHLALRRGERLRAPATEMTWKTPGGAMHATVVDVIYKKAKHKPPISKLIVWNHSKRFDMVRTKHACDAFSELRPANDMVVFRCGSRPVDNEPEGMIEDWLLRWSAEKQAPLRNKHWSGDPAADEPAWARDRKAEPPE